MNCKLQIENQKWLSRLECEDVRPRASGSQDENIEKPYLPREEVDGELGKVIISSDRIREGLGGCPCRLRGMWAHINLTRWRRHSGRYYEGEDEDRGGER